MIRTHARALFCIHLAQMIRTHARGLFFWGQPKLAQMISARAFHRKLAVLLKTVLLWRMTLRGAAVPLAFA